MALRESGARYKYGLSRLRIRAKNDDMSLPTPSRMIGGAGPFDFSKAVAPAAVTGFLKIDKATTKNFTINLTTGGVTISAVTVDQWVSAMTAGLTAAAITGFTASKDATTGRAKLVSNSGAYVQFWGEAAMYSRFGQGRGLKAIKSDTAQTLSLSPTMKDDQTISITDANLKDTDVIIVGYKKGFTGSLVDTAEDFEMMALIESGTIDTQGAYIDPDSATVKVEVEIETYNPLYAAGTNLESAIVGWEHMHLRAVKGNTGDDTMESGFNVKTYNLIGTNYKDENGDETGAIKREFLASGAWSPADFDAT